ncbi:MAG: tetratricopeptide repeat protein [Treponema sp.]|nr:tetratricopeptide repeat protein [Treponema sp.]
MAENVETLKLKKQENSTKKLENFMTRNRKPILISGICILVLALAVCLFLGITDSIRKKALAAIDEIEYTYTKNFNDMTEGELPQRQDTALESLKPYLEKKDFAGVRANMLSADIYYSKNDYASALDYYVKAAETGSKFYTASICYYNAAVCSEELGKTADAISYYQSAADDQNFTLASHALFNAARVNETEGNYAEAAALYKKMIDSYSSDSWTNLAQSRLVQLRIDGKTE